MCCGTLAIKSVTPALHTGRTWLNLPKKNGHSFQAALRLFSRVKAAPEEDATALDTKEKAAAATVRVAGASGVVYDEEQESWFVAKPQPDCACGSQDKGA